VETTFHLLAPVEAAAPVSGKQPAGKGQATPAAGPAAGTRLDLELKADYVYTRLRGGDGSLPRIPPFRTSAALVLGYDRFTARLEGQYAAAQTRTADFELPTDSFFLLNAGLTCRVMEGPVTMDVFVRGTNLLDAEARLHTSFLKDIAPMEGRGVMVGLQAVF
jgi:iron complex outermembrane receptor protein